VRWVCWPCSRPRQWPGVTTCISLAPDGSPGNGESGAPAISKDARWAAFQSGATNLVAGDTNAKDDIFIRELDVGLTERVSVSTSGAESNGASERPFLSTDGRCVAFVSVGEFVDVPLPNTASVWVRDIAAGVVELGSADTDGAQLGQMNPPAISADGRYLVLNSLFGGVPVRLRDRLTGTVEVLSVGTHGELPGLTSNFAYDQCLSADGRFALFGSSAGNLVPGDTNGVTDVFLRDRRPFFADLGQGLAGVSGVPALSPSGVLLAGEPVSFALTAAHPLAASALLISPVAAAAPFKGGTLVPAPTLLLPFTTSPAGQAALSVAWPAKLPSNLQLYVQWWIQDDAAPAGVSGSNAVLAITP
jgi:hypothetical protein